MAIGRRWFTRSALAALAAVGAIAAVSMSSGAQPARRAAATAPAPVPVTISSSLPPDLNPGRLGGAPNATLDQAAAFAWQEFIALNWPARMQRGRLGDRDNPGTDCLFGGVPNPRASPQPTDCATRPLTWQTFRGKAEIFPARPNNVLYDALPNYAGLYTSTVPACPGVTPSGQTVWVNLDETSEIGLAGMYAGAGPKTDPNNSAPQLIRFMAKANRQEFGYANRINARDGVSQAMLTATSTYVQSYGSPPQGSTRYVSLPTNTIEIKAGWRQLNPQIDDPSHFHTTRVRYYEAQGPGGAQCYREGTWGLVSLHIIRKTQTAPYFIYATFEQIENIRTVSGTPTERADGTVVARQPCRADQSAPCPTTPTTVYQDSGDPNVQPNVSLQPAGAAYCDSAAGAIGSRIYYHNIVTAGAQTQVPTGGPVCINARQHPIPPTIIAANQTAQAAIAAYNQAYGITRSPWAYYRLINVQYRPMSLTTPGSLYSGPDPATFYQSNSVVESNYSLQNFSGRLVYIRNFGLSGAKSDFASRFGNATACPPDNPTCTTAVAALYYRRPGVRYASGYDMGGCMGCHGTAQRGGTDFSFIFGAVVRAVEPIPQQTNAGLVTPDTARIRELIRWSR